MGIWIVFTSEGRFPMASTSVAESATSGMSFEGLVEMHQAMVFSLAYHFLHDRATAEEVAQDVFLELYSHLEELDSPDHLVFWLRKVTANRSIDEARRRHRRAEVEIEAAGDPASPADAEGWVNLRIRRLVASLPERQRMIIILRYQEDLEPVEIAALLEVSVNTVKSQLQRALTLLREKAGVEKRA
jgi:RNA polymerase sigma-70 factor, ECF subfamily